jgi:hypothetical protein
LCVMSSILRQEPENYMPKYWGISGWIMTLNES